HHGATHPTAVNFGDCPTPARQLIGGKEGQGFKTAMKVLDRGRLSIAAVCVGVAERLIRDSVAYAMERKQFGRPIADFQLVQAMLADSQTEAYAARSMVLDAARRPDAGEVVTMEASCCKLYASEMVGRVADRAVQIHGGAGYIADYGVERFYRDVRLFRLYEGTSQIQQLIIAPPMIPKAGGGGRGRRPAASTSCSARLRSPSSVPPTSRRASAAARSPICSLPASAAPSIL